MTYIKNKTGYFPKFVHSDGGGEFMAGIVRKFDDSNGITHTFTSPHSSQQNGVAERINRTISEGSTALLVTACLPVTFWFYSVNFFTYIKNRTPHKSLNLSNPLTEWNIYNINRSLTDIYDLRIFGCEAFVLDEYTKKNCPKAFRCIYLGPSQDHKGSYFYNLYTQKIMTSRNFILNEDCFPGTELYPNIYTKYVGPNHYTKYTSSTLSSTPQQRSPSTTTTIPSDSIPTPPTPTPSAIPDHDMFVLDTTTVSTFPTNDASNIRTINPDSDDISVFYRNVRNFKSGIGDLPSLTNIDID
jgi:hypothetical protein